MVGCFCNARGNGGDLSLKAFKQITQREQNVVEISWNKMADEKDKYDMKTCSRKLCTKRKGDVQNQEV